MSGSRDERFAVSSDLRIVCMRIARRVRAENTDEIAEHEYSVLVQVEEDGPRTLRQLADRDGVSAPVMTRNVNSLEELGYVERRPDDDDGRKVLVALTPAGSALIQRIRLNRDQWMASRVEALGPDEFAVLREATALLQRLEAS